MTWWNRRNLRNFDGIICHGAVRSGKTVSMVNGFFLWSMTAFQGQVFGICGRTIGALRRNIIEHLPHWLGSVYTIEDHRGDNRLVVRDSRGRKNTYYLFGGQDEGSAKVIQGITLAGILLDEAALMPQSFVEQACARCSVPGSKLWFNCNPEGPEHWFYRNWVLPAGEKGLLALHFTMNDNPGLSAAVRERYERLYQGLFYRRFVLGQWCRAEGLVYDFDPGKHVGEIENAECRMQNGPLCHGEAVTAPPKGEHCGRREQESVLRGDSEEYYISVDYGVQNPFSAGLWCVVGDVAYRIDEFYFSGREAGYQMTDEEYHEALVKLAAGRPIRRVFVDPSAASFIACLRRHGVFSVRKAKNAVLPGIRLVAQLLQEGRLKIGPGCKNAIREFSLYSWEADGQDRPRKEDDHAMDEIRYFCMGVMRK